MTAVMFLVAAVVLAILGSVLVWLRYREPSPKRMSSIEEFHRGLEALSPRPRPEEPSPGQPLPGQPLPGQPLKE